MSSTTSPHASVAGRIGWTRPQRTVSGRSNGGLLVEATITQHPELFSAALEVSVMDMLRFDKFTIGSAWTATSAHRAIRRVRTLLAYSPVRNIRAAWCIRRRSSRPAITTTAWSGHSFKFAAASGRPGRRPVLIRIDTDAGHSMSKPVHKLIDGAPTCWRSSSSSSGRR
jgi:prolyl oligopeptidase